MIYLKTVMVEEYEKEDYLYEIIIDIIYNNKKIDKLYFKFTTILFIEFMIYINFVECKKILFDDYCQYVGKNLLFENISFGINNNLLKFKKII